MTCASARLLSLVLSGVACGPGTVQAPQDTGLEGLALRAVNPDTLLPGSVLVVEGESFVAAEWGATRLRLEGTFRNEVIDLTLAARFVDYQRLEIRWDGGSSMGLPFDSGTFQGDATVEVISAVDGDLYASRSVPVELRVAPELAPRLDSVATGVIFVNEPIAVEGAGFLLGGDEGTTLALVEGCYQRDGQASCVPVAPVELPVAPETAYDRTRGVFSFDPSIAGLDPGEFTGTVTLVNRAPGGADADSGPTTVDYTVVPPAVFRITPDEASLAQYVEIHGGGFVGGRGSPYLTVVELVGTVRVDGAGADVPIDLQLIPAFVSGPLVRYVVDQADFAIDLHRQAATFSGTIRPVVSDGDGNTVRGDATVIGFRLAHVKQVVWVRFLPAYVESLRDFGLRAVDTRVRARVLEVIRRDYQGVNLEVRTEPPSDFALYSTVEIGGPDPNGLGLFGYDNTPGKDLGNARLFDKIGGVNAKTLEDGSPGYGGVFVESFFNFSQHPGSLGSGQEQLGDPLFDQIFDGFRPDLGGRPVLSADLAGLPTLTSSESCPATDRTSQIACAIWVLGSMVGTTTAHELGHSLGLANPTEERAYHNSGDQPNRLMDGGGARTFLERAELQGEGPGRFCDDDYLYLRDILPSEEPAPEVHRPSCF
jgi:hypothetical protein